VVQAAFAQLVAGKQQRTFLVVLAPVVQIPVELEKLFVVVEHPLPDREQLEAIARELTSDSPNDLPQGDDLQRLLDAASGLTRYEAEGAFALSLTRHNALRPEAVWELKACNDISKLPPEFARAERFDGVFFLDLPTAAEKQAIWGLYRRQFQIPEGQAQPDDASWTGAEVRACCRLAALLDVPLAEAAQHVVPVAVTAAEQVERLRSWASGRCLAASAPGVYRRDGEPPPRPGRRVQRGPSNN